MNNSVASISEHRSLSRFWRYVFIVGLFLLVWPAITGALVWTIEFSGMDWLVASLIYAYLFCAPSALLAGIIHGVAAIRFHRNSILVPLGAAMTAAVLVVAQIELPFGVSPEKIINGLVFVLPIALIASLMCWRLTRHLARME